VSKSHCRWAVGKAAVAPKLDPARGPCPTRGVRQGVKGTDAQPPLGKALQQQGTLDLNGLKKWTRYFSVCVCHQFSAVVVCYHDLLATHDIAQCRQSSSSKARKHCTESHT